MRCSVRTTSEVIVAAKCLVCGSSLIFDVRPAQDYTVCEVAVKPCPDCLMAVLKSMLGNAQISIDNYISSKEQ